ncbi:ATP-binding protein [Flavobacterium sp. NRK1]|nr:ATP-binding protein [Flavobacterium sp. NRK1]
MLFICLQSYSQSEYYFTWYSSDSNHLPQNSVKSILQDKYGFLWLATENGIVRYDGKNFKIYNSENTNNINSNRMMLFSGSIENDSIIIFNEKEEAFLIHKRGIKRVHGIYYPQKSLKNISDKSYLLYHSQLYTRPGKPFALTSDERTFVLRNDSIMVLNNSFKCTEKFEYTYKDSSQFFVNAGKLYLLGPNNDYTLCTSENKKFTKFDIKLSQQAKVYSNIPAKQTFIFSEKKLYYLKSYNGKFTSKLVFDNFDCEENNIVSVYYDDKNEVLFLGSTNKGLLIAKKKDFKHNSTDYHHNSGTDDVYYALTKYSSNSILTSTGEIFNKNGETNVIQHIGYHTDKYNIIIDDDGNIWTKNGSKLYKFTKKSKFIEHYEWRFRNSISTIEKGSDHTIYISIFNDKDKKGGFLYSINTDSLKPNAKLEFKLSFASSCLKAISKNIYWSGSWAGLYQIDVKSKTSKKISDLSNAHVRSIYVHNANEAWISTYNKGFFLYKNNKITSFPLDRNKYLLSVHCIVEDKEGFMWLTTNKGLFAAKKQDLFNYADHKINNIYYHTYNKDAGFINNEFNGGCSPCGVYLENQTLFLPSMDGIVYYNPSEIKKRQPYNDIYLDEVYVDNKSCTLIQNLEFNRNFERLKFYLTSPFYGNTYNQNIETRLEGPVFQDWVAMTEDNVSFSTLPPGEYIFKARKLLGFGSKYIYKDFHFCVAPAFWQTEWFCIVLIVLTILAIYFIYRLRIRYIKKKNIQLEKQVVLKTQQLQNTIVTLRKTKDDLSKQVTNHKNLIKTITHDIKSPLRFIAITGRFLYKNIEKPEAIVKEDIKAIYSSSSQLYHFVDNFLEYAKETDLNNNESQPYSLYSLIQEKSDFFENIASAAKTTLINNIDKNIVITVNRHLLSIILHNIIDNAIKNTINGTISFKAVINNKTVAIRIKDTGRGIEPGKLKYYQDLLEGSLPSKRQKGIGLHMIIELLAVMGGTMNINSKKDSGTVIILSFRQNH